MVPVKFPKPELSIAFTVKLIPFASPVPGKERLV